MTKWIKTGYMVLVFVLCAVVLYMTFGETKADAAKLNSPGGALGLGIAQFLAGLAVIATIALVVKNLMSNPKGAIRIAIALVVMLIIFFIGKSMDAGEVYPKYNVEEGVSKNVGGLITLTYALGIVSAIAFVGALIMSIIKK